MDDKASEEYRKHAREFTEEWEGRRIRQAESRCAVIRKQLDLALATLDEIEPGAIPSGHEDELLRLLIVQANVIKSEVEALIELPWADKPDPRPNGLPPDVNETLRQFAAQNGRTWKAALRELWSSGRDDRHPLNGKGHLRWARNAIGSRGLEKVSF